MRFIFNPFYLYRIALKLYITSFFCQYIFSSWAIKLHFKKLFQLNEKTQEYIRDNISNKNKSSPQHIDITRFSESPWSWFFVFPTVKMRFSTFFLSLKFLKRKTFQQVFSKFVKTSEKDWMKLLKIGKTLEIGVEKKQNPTWIFFQPTEKRVNIFLWAYFFPPGETDNLLRFTWENTKVKNFFIIEKHNFRSRYQLLFTLWRKLSKSNWGNVVFIGVKEFFFNT